MDSFSRKVRETISRYHMVRAGERVAVGVSGGPDSMACLHALLDLKEELELELVVIHINHGLRGTEAEGEERFVAEEAARLGLPFRARRIEVGRGGGGRSLQMRAREARLKAFGEEVKRLGADRLALGHTADDQAETVLLRLLEGTGLRGLSAMAPVREGWIIRPLIERTRQEVEGFLERRGVPFCQDPTNLKPIYTRNRLRLELLPLLKQKYNPALISALCRLAALAREDEEYLTGIAWEKLEALGTRGSGLELELESLLALPQALMGRVLREAIRELKGNLQGISWRHVQSLKRLISSVGPSKCISLPGGLRAERSYGRLRLLMPRAEGALEALTLNLSGESRFGPWLFRCRRLKAEEEDAKPRPGMPMTAWLDAQSAGGELLLRTRRPGDRFRPLGVGGGKKLKDFLIDLKVPPSQREELPLVVGKNGVLWVVGYRISHEVRLTEESREVLRIDAEGPLSPKGIH